MGRYIRRWLHWGCVQTWLRRFEYPSRPLIESQEHLLHVADPKVRHAHLPVAAIRRLTLACPLGPSVHVTQVGIPLSEERGV